MPSGRIKVLRVIARLNVGGPALHVSLLTSRLDPDRFESVLATGTPGPGEGDMLDLRPQLRDELGDRLVTIAGLGRSVHPLRDARATLELDRLIRRLRPDIVHTHTAKAGAIARPLARLHRVPHVVHTFHGTTFGGHFSSRSSRAVALAERGLARLTDRILAVSPTVADQLRNAGLPADRIDVVPLGLDLDRFAAVPPLEGQPPDAITLVARLVPVKDVELFLAAARLVREQRPGVDVRIAGDGPLRHRLERDAPPFVRFLGHVADLPAELAATAVVALSSRSEGSPVALIEALAAARPVVAVPVGGVPDVLSGRPGALVVRDRSAKALAEGLLTALEGPTMAEEAAAGRQAVLADYGITRLVRDIETLYERLVDRP